MGEGRKRRGNQARGSRVLSPRSHTGGASFLQDRVLTTWVRNSQEVHEILGVQGVVGAGHLDTHR